MDGNMNKRMYICMYVCVFVFMHKYFCMFPRIYGYLYVRYMHVYNYAGT